MDIINHSRDLFHLAHNTEIYASIEYAIDTACRLRHIDSGLTQVLADIPAADLDSHQIRELRTNVVGANNHSYTCGSKAVTRLRNLHSGRFNNPQFADDDPIWDDVVRRMSILESHMSNIDALRLSVIKALDDLVS